MAINKSLFGRECLHYSLPEFFSSCCLEQPCSNFSEYFPPHPVKKIQNLQSVHESGSKASSKVHFKVQDKLELQRQYSEPGSDCS